MRIIHVASYSNEFFNGIRSVLEELAPAQRTYGHEVWIFNHEKNDRKEVDGEVFIGGFRVFIRYIKSIQPDLVVFHSLYGMKDVCFSFYLRLRGIPYLVEPHGGTSKENSRKSRVKKLFANLLFVNSYLHHAMGLIYLNEIEKNGCVFQAIRRDCAVIPNGTHLHGSLSKSSSTKVVRFVFLARIDIYGKGLDLLFPAIEEANRKGAINKAEFHFYGKARDPHWGMVFNDYISKASNNVYYHGPAIGIDKKKAFEEGDIFVLTSRYEGMPMAVLEALSYGLPCLLTPQTHVTDIVVSNNCGWVTDLSIEEISIDILKVIDDFNSRRQELMINALQAASQFDWNSIAERSIKEYERLVGKKAS